MANLQLRELLQRMKPRMFLWLWQTTFEEERVLLERLEHLEQMRNGTVHGGLPRIVRVSAKDPRRNPSAKTAMRIDPVGEINVVGDFALIPFAPIPGVPKPLLYHQWGAGGKGTDIEFVGLPGGGKAEVIKCAESPRGLTRTTERRSRAMRDPGEVPGYHFRSWDGWLWFEVTTAAGDAFEGAWEVVKGLAVVHMDDIGRVFSLPERASLPYLPASLLGTSYHVARDLPKMEARIDLCTNPGRHSVSTGSGVSLSGWQLEGGRVEAGERLVLVWACNQLQTATETAEGEPTDSRTHPAAPARQERRGKHARKRVRVPARFDGWVGASLALPGCRPWVCMTGRARAQIPVALAPDALQTQVAERGGEQAEGPESTDGERGATAGGGLDLQEGNGREKCGRGHGGEDDVGDLVVYDAAQKAKDGSVGEGRGESDEYSAACEPPEAERGAAGSGGGPETWTAVEGGMSRIGLASESMVVEGAVAACEHALLCMGDNAGWGEPGRAEGELLDIGERLHEAVPLTLTLTPHDEQADDEEGAEEEEEEDGGHGKSWTVEACRLVLPLHLVNAWLRNAGRLEDRPALSLASMEAEAGTPLIGATVRPDATGREGGGHSAGGGAGEGMAGVRVRRDGISCPYRRVRWTSVLSPAPNG